MIRGIAICGLVVTNSIEFGFGSTELLYPVGIEGADRILWTILMGLGSGKFITLFADGLQLSGKGATLLVDLADRVGEITHPALETIFLAGAWAAVFSSLLGVWQSVPYLFSDFWNLHCQNKSLDPENFEPYRVDTKGRAYRGFLIGLSLVPILGLRYDFQLVQKANSVFGAFVMPMLALALLILNSRKAWVGESMKNRSWTTATLVIVLVFFAWVGFPKLMAALGLGV